MKRVGLAAAWLAASYLGTLLVVFVELHAAPIPPWFVLGAVGWAPSAILLAGLVHDRVWSFVIVAGLAVLLPVERLVVNPALGPIVHLLAPPITFPPPTRIDYLPEAAVGNLLFGAIAGLLQLAFLWPYLKPRWMWPGFKAAAGAASALVLVWPEFLLLPVPGMAAANWPWLTSLITAAGLGVLWRFDAKAPRLRRPPFRLPRPVEQTVDPAYAEWMADLERSLEAEQT